MIHGQCALNEFYLLKSGVLFYCPKNSKGAALIVRLDRYFCFNGETPLFLVSLGN